MQRQWATSLFTGSYADAKAHSARFAEYKQTTKRTWVAEKQDLATLFGNVQTKLKTYRLREYVPPPGLSLTVRVGVVKIGQTLTAGGTGCRCGVGRAAAKRSETLQVDQRADPGVGSFHH
jgi:hypothetical protein